MLNDFASHARSHLWSCYHVSSEIIYYTGKFGFVIIILAGFQAKQSYSKMYCCI